MLQIRSVQLGILTPGTPITSPGTATATDLRSYSGPDNIIVGNGNAHPITSTANIPLSHYQTGKGSYCAKSTEESAQCFKIYRRV